MQKILLLTVVISFFASRLHAEEFCYDVFPQSALTDECGSSVEVHISKFECQNKSNIIGEYKPILSKIKCETQSKQLISEIDGKLLISELGNVKIWGGGSEFKILNTRIGAALERGIVKKETIRKNKRTPASMPRANEEKNSFKKIEKPKIIEIKVEENKKEKKINDVTKVETSEVSVKLSGFIWYELENSKNFGYDRASGRTNFKTSHEDFSTTFANIQLDVKKQATQLTTVFEIGEIYGGDSSTGGAVGAKDKNVETRNLFVSHNFTEEMNLKFGIQPILADPNGFVFNDNLSSQQLTLQKDWGSLSIWSGRANADKPGLDTSSADHVETNQYYGFSQQSKFADDGNVNLYGIYRSTRESFYDENTSTVVSGKSIYTWLGLTLTAPTWNDVSFQTSLINNGGGFSADSNGRSDSLRGYLLDFRLLKSFKNEEIDLSFEALGTSGSNDSYSIGQSVQTIGKRKNFNSPGPSYLLTVATNDGADDAPGAPKESVIANLNQADGVRIYVIKANKSFSDKYSGLIRYGVVNSATTNQVTNSKSMGTEFDIEFNYLFDPSISLQVEYGKFTPGSYFVNKEAAELLTTRIKFSL